MTSNKFLFPDALYDINSISCASFLYFDKGQILISLHPMVSTFITGCDPYDFCKFVDDKKPSWSSDYFILFKLWEESNVHISNTTKLLKNLKDNNAYKSIWLAYSKDEKMLGKAEKFISKQGLSYEQLFEIINIDQAVQELMAHIHLSKVTELYGTPSEKPKLEFIKRQVDYNLLFEYCEKLFKKTPIKKALVLAYFIRVVSIDKLENVMISNENLIPLLAKESNKKVSKRENNLTNEEFGDVISWELFRQIVSPYLDEKEPAVRISLTGDILQMRAEETTRLKSKCLLLADDFRNDFNLSTLSKNVAKHVKLHVEKDLKDLLALDKSAYADIRDKIFSDEKTWLAFLAFTTSLYTGGELIAAGSGLAALSNVFAKTYDVKSNINKSVKKSDYALIYRIKKR